MGHGRRARPCARPGRMPPHTQMMKWIQVDAALIAEAFNHKEAAAIQQGRDMEPTDPVPGILAGVAARIRAAVLACGRVRLRGDESCIPQALRGEAVAILRFKLLVRFSLAVTEERKSEAAAAEERLDAIARGDYPLAEDIISTRPTYHGRPHRWSSPHKGGVMRGI